jgi:hypothetical protein
MRFATAMRIACVQSRSMPGAKRPLDVEASASNASPIANGGGVFAGFGVLALRWAGFAFGGVVVGSSRSSVRGAAVGCAGSGGAAGGAGDGIETLVSSRLISSDLFVTSRDAS